MSVSVVINTKNAGQTLRQALVSVADWADEIVVVDMFSTDDTVQIAREYTDHVFQYHKNLAFADPARNFALEKATQEWTLVLDADEEAPASLLTELTRLTKNPTAESYFIPRQNEIFGKLLKHSGWWPDHQLRFFRTGTVHWTDKVHTQPVATGKSEHLAAEPKFALLHHNYQSVSQFIERLNRYTSIGVADRTAECNPAELITIFQDELVRRAFSQHGIDDGLHGVSLSFLQAMYESVSYLKVWEQAGFPEKKDQQDQALRAFETLKQTLHYWITTERIHRTTGVERWWWRLRRKLGF